MIITHRVILLSTIICLTVAEKVFRTEKINFVYQKAMHHINDKQRLLKLEGDLDGYDKMYLDTKDSHVLAEDNGAEMKKDLTRIDEKLMKLLSNYDLEQTIQAFKEKMKHKHDLKHTEEVKDVRSVQFDDDVIQGIWEKALLSKLSEKKLQAIHAELKKAVEKMSHFENVLKEFNKVPENDIEHEHETGTSVNKNKQLKEAHKDLHDHLDQVRGSLSKPFQSQFESPEARALWKLAQTKKHTPEALEVLKEEIIQFDKQLQKQELIKSNKKQHDNEPDAKVDHIAEAEFNAKDELMNRKIIKMKKYIKEKIVHKEL